MKSNYSTAAYSSMATLLIKKTSHDYRYFTHSHDYRSCVLPIVDWPRAASTQYQLPVKWRVCLNKQPYAHSCHWNKGKPANHLSPALLNLNWYCDTVMKESVLCFQLCSWQHGGWISVLHLRFLSRPRNMSGFEYKIMISLLRLAFTSPDRAYWVEPLVC